MAQSTHAIGMCDMRHTEFYRLCKHFDYFVPRNMFVRASVREDAKIREDDDTQALSFFLFFSLRLSLVSTLVSFRNSNYVIYMTPIWMVYTIYRYHTVLKFGSLKLLPFSSRRSSLDRRLLSTFFSHRKCTHHSVSIHVGHRKISISHDDCLILHWLSNWNDFIALCGCIFVYLLLFFLLYLSSNVNNAIGWL